ncbi:DoxX family protein [Nocardia sp. NPDC052566]|uniref:DoxX family protein n=1 Tax=Nocardia sp. NPDC052566 TaxID=3364330 RepID=UPI0037CC3777
MTAVTKEIDLSDAEPAGSADPEPPRPWNPLTRIAFRFSFVYFGLFCLLFAQILWVFAGYFTKSLPEEAILWQMRLVMGIPHWVGLHLFGVDAVFHENSGSGDQAVIWLLIFCEAVVAVVVTVVWTVLDRRRVEYARLGSWFLTFIRLCLAGQMLFYGMAKLIPTQMPPPSLTTLLLPFGGLHPFEVLWNQVGVSPQYESLLGLAEVLGGLLLFWPRTATVGAMLSLVSLAQVFVLNMTFDVPVKILAFHLMVLSMVLLAPQARRLANFLVLERHSEPARQPALFRTQRANRIAAVVQVVLGLWILSGTVQLGVTGYTEFGAGAPKPELYGIWNVTDFSVDGHQLPPLTTDETRWRRLVFDIGGTTVYQRMNDDLVPVAATLDAQARTIAMSEPPTAPDAAPKQFAAFSFDRTAPDRLTLTGELNGRPVTVALQQVDLDSFPVRGSRFHWVQDNPQLR